MADNKKKNEEKAEKKEEMIKETATFELKLSHDTVTFSSSKLGEQMTAFWLKMTNPMKERVAYKVKCTSNEMFKIKQPVGYVDPSQSVEVQMVHNPGKVIPENGKQYFAVYYLKVDKDVEANFPVRDFLKNKKEFDGVKRLYIDFNRNGKPWEEEARKEKEWEKEKVVIKKKAEEEREKERKKEKEEEEKKEKEEKKEEKKEKKDDKKDDKKDKKEEKKKEKDEEKEEKKEKKKEDKKEEKKEDKEDKKDEEKEKK